MTSSPMIGRRYARKFMSGKAKGGFIEPMLLLRTEQLPDGPEWLHELKFDGYRALAVKNGGADETIIDGEVVALDGDASPPSTCSRITPRVQICASYTSAAAGRPT